jgi:hypothetical protein
MKTKSLLIVVLLIVSTITFSQTIYVNSSTGNDAAGDGTLGNPYKTFHKGYTMVSSGGTLDLTGTFTWTDADETGDVAANGYVISKNINIFGQSNGSTIIQADVTENTADRRVLTLSAGYTVELRDLTIKHGYSTVGNWYSDGGGGLKSMANLTMRRCIITNNRLNSLVNSNSGSGGGAYISGGNVNVLIDDCIFRNNSNTSSYRYGGGLAICSISTTVILSNSTFNNNTNADGSGLFFYGSWSTPKPHIYNCTFTANSGGTYGACFLDRKGCYVTNCTFANNPSGGLVVYGDTFYFKEQYFCK